MTASRPSLILLSCSFVLQIANQVNGESTPPWTTYRGCYGLNSGSGNKTLSDNSPTNCFKECTNFTHIGIQASICFCVVNMPPKTQRKHESTCLSGQSMFLYSKVIDLPIDIGPADYGYVYVSIGSLSSSIKFRATNGSLENHGLLCTIDFTWTCDFRRGAANNVNGERANSTCSLVSYLDFNSSCQTNDGDYWIGMFRETPVFSSTALVETSTNTSSLLSSSTQQTFTISDNTSATFPPIDPIISSTMKVTLSPITQIPSASPITNIGTVLQYPEPTSPKEDTWKIMAIAFIAISVALTIVVIAGIVAFIRRRKENKVSDQKDEPASVKVDNEEIDGKPTLDRQASTSPLTTMPGTNKTLEGKTFEINERFSEERRGEEDGYSYEQPVQDPKHRKTKRKVNELLDQEEALVINVSDTTPEIRKKKRKHKKSHRHEKTDVMTRSDTTVEHNPLDNVEDNNKKKKKKKKKKRRRKHANSSDASDGKNVFF